MSTLTDPRVPTSASPPRLLITRTWWAALCALVVALAGLAAPAQAATGSAVISGQVTVPAGATTAGTTVEAWPVGSNFRHSSVALGPDGTFSLDLGDATTSTYHLRILATGSSTLATGWHSTGSTLAVRRSAASTVTAGSTGVVVGGVSGASISGQVEYPSGYSGLTSVRVEAPDSQSAGLLNQVFVTNGTYVAKNLIPGGDYVVRIYSFDQGTLYDGWLRAGGAWGPKATAATVTAPTTGLVLRPNLAGSISGRVDLPQGAQDGAWVGAYSADGVRVDVAYTYSEGTFTIDELDTATSYRIEVTTSSETVGGYYTAGGAVVPGYANGVGVRPPASDLVIRPTSVPAIRGQVELPPGFTFGWDASPSVIAYSQDDDGTWRWDRSVGVHSTTGRFSVTDVEPGTSYRLRFDADTDQAGTLRSGWWTGDTTALTADETRARTVTPTTYVTLPLQLTATKAPTVWGSTALGGTLNASRGTWVPAADEYRFQWLRNGTPIAGATTSRYKVVRADLGLNLSVRVTAVSPDRPQGTARSATLRIPKVAPKVSITAPTSATRGQPVSVTVRVATPGVSTAPAGTVRVSYTGGSRTVSLAAAHRGTITVRLTGLARGSHTLRAVYTPSTTMARYVTTGTSAGVVLRVR